MECDLEVYKWAVGAEFLKVREVVKDLRDRRIVKGIKQGEIAKKLGVYQPKVSELENNTKPCSIKFVSQYITLLREVLKINEPLIKKEGSK